MSAFYESWKQCMHSNGFPVPSVECAEEALEILHKMHSAWENAGGGEELTIGALIALGAVTGVDEGLLAAIAEVAVIVYISAGIGCISSVAFDELKGLFAANQLPDFVVAELSNQGIDLAGEATV